MHRPLLSLAALVLIAGCSKPAPQQQQSAVAPAGVQWAVIVLYNQPKDTAAFEKYYAEKHVPLFASHAQEIGVTRVELIRFSPSADGKPAPSSGRPISAGTPGRLVTRAWPRRASRPSPGTCRCSRRAGSPCSSGRRPTNDGAYRDSRRAARGRLAHRPTVPRAGRTG